MKKRILATILAAAMVMSMSTVVNAATQIDAGTTVTLPEKSLIVDGGFEAATILNPDDPATKKSYIPTFTATEDEGLSTERVFNNAQIISEAGMPVEGKQCILLRSEENATIALPNLYNYKGGKLKLTYYVRAKAAALYYGTWGKLEDRGVMVPDEKEPTKMVYPVVASFVDGINYYTQPEGTTFDKVWTCLKEEIVIPDTITPNSQYVFDFGSFGNSLYYDAISCVLEDEEGNDVTAEVATQSSEKEAKILCIGDSITHGNGLETSYFTSYRYPLWKKLIDAGVDFEMVGPREGNFNKNCTFEEYKGQTFNNKHYAQYGVKLEAMKGMIGADCADIDFNVAIINLGTNDRKVNGETEIAWTCENIPAWLAEMTNTLRTINPNVTVFLTGMIDSWPGVLNGAIQEKAEEITTADSPVYYVPAPAGWIADPNNPNATTLDWCHPNELGCQKMADTYYDALMEHYFNPKSPVEQPTPTLDVDDESNLPEVNASPTPTATPAVTVGPERSPRPSRSPSPATSPTSTPTATPTVTPNSTPSNGVLVSGDYQYTVKSDNTIEITGYTGSKTILDIPASIDGHTVTGIGKKAFANNDVLEMIVLPDTIKTIGEYAFESCRKLDTVNLGSSVETIEDYAFFNCQSLALIAVPESVKNIGKYAFGYDGSYSLIYGFSMTGYAGSTAEKYANENKMKFYDLAIDATKKSIKFTKKSVKIKKGKKVTLKVKLTGAKKATFTTSKKKVVKIVKKKAKKVTIKGMKKGKAVITAKAAGKKAKCKVTVK